MEIYLPDELVERLREHLKKNGYCLPVDTFIEEAIDYRIESHPWGFGDICVHNQECMHWKTVGEWNQEREGSK